jgi:hypothetical protein
MPADVAMVMLLPRLEDGGIEARVAGDLLLRREAVRVPDGRPDHCSRDGPTPGRLKSSRKDSSSCKSSRIWAMMALASSSAEWSLVALAHNLLKIYRQRPAAFTTP